jgi:hypothetical protein
MRSLLEKALVHLLNEDNDKAVAMFHKFVVERSRQIHEDNRMGEDSLDKDWDSEEHVSEDDLTDLEDKGDEMSDGVEDEIDGDVDMEADLDLDGVDGDEVAADELEGDLGDEVADEEVGQDDRIAELQKQLDELTAEFDDLMSDEDDSDVDGEVADDEMSDDMSDEVVADDEMKMDDEEVKADDEEVKADDEEMKDHMFEDDEFDELSESLMDELEKICVDQSADGKQSDGKKVEQNSKSPVSGGRKSEAKPIMTKRDDHAGFERETAPVVKDPMKKRKFTRAKAMDDMKPVSKDSKALLNKDFSK